MGVWGFYLYLAVLPSNTVSKNKPRQLTQNPTAKNTNTRTSADLSKPAGMVIPYPYLWLALVVVIVYFPTFSFGLTELDDSIFIHEFRAYNQDLHNLITSFQRGLFDAVKDPYYRPLFLDSMVLNFQGSDEGQNVTSYHIINVLFHIISVILLYKLFRKLEVKELYAFILSMLFAIHPVLSQAVAWIPGRNDTMLTIFILSFLICCINYSNNGKTKDLVLSALFLILAFFTKETAAFAPLAAFILLVVMLNKKWLDKRNLIQYSVWTACFLLWFWARSQASTASSGIATSHAFSDLANRLPVIIQYLGKIFLPFNLSVFPEQQDTVYYYGIIAIVILGVTLYFNKQRDLRVILGGSLLFLLFLMPALLVPQELNQQTFEHRLYLPVIGILLLLSQTTLLRNKLSDKQLLTGTVAVYCIFAVINFRHQKNFADPISFWTQAAETSPNSAYANMMLAARLDEKEFDRSCALFHKAYLLNPKEKYLNFYYGVMLQKKDSVLQSEPHLLAEKKISDYYECDFYLARVAMERKDPNGAIAYLQSYLKRDPVNKIANNNLLLLYMDTEQKEKAAAQATHMRQLGIEVPSAILQKLSH